MPNNKYNATRNHPLFATFHLMLARCKNKNRPNYKYYGGRGIKVCERWVDKNGFQNFVKDMGEKPALNYSLDRIDVNGNYEPKNCRWATHYVQMANTTHVGEHPGVNWNKKLNKWRVRIKVKGKEVALGWYRNLEDAIMARKNYENVHSDYGFIQNISS